MGLKIFKSTDAGAPVLTNALGSWIGVLDACLVNGYGSKPSLGWSIAFNETNKRAYRTAQGNRYYLGVDDSLNIAWTGVRGFMTVSSAGISEIGASGFFPSAAQVAIPYLGKSAAMPWQIYGDEKCFYAFYGPINNQQNFFFGDYDSYLPNDQYNVLIIAGTATSGAPASTNASCLSVIAEVNATCVGHYCPKKYDGLSGPVGFGKRAADSYHYGAVSGAGNAIYPDPATSGILLSPVKVHEVVDGSCVQRGRLPGLWFSLHNINALQVFTQDSVSGTPGTLLEGRTFDFLRIYYNSSHLVVMETSDTWYTVNFR